jgi:hypothetical protein
VPQAVVDDSQSQFLFLFAIYSEYFQEREHLSYTGPPRAVACPTWPRAGMLEAPAHALSCGGKAFKAPKRC